MYTSVCILANYCNNLAGIWHLEVYLYVENVCIFSTNKVPGGSLTAYQLSPVTAEKKKLDSYFQVGTYRMAGTINECVFLFYIRRNLL
jgi:hypothetical protein